MGRRALDGLALYTTTKFPNNETQGSATNASRIIIGDFTELLVGVRSELRIETLLPAVRVPRVAPLRHRRCPSRVVRQDRGHHP